MLSLHFSALLFLVCALHSIERVSAAVFADPSQLPKAQYDFIVVGGGSAGNVVANRLTENPKFSVLVIEAGGTNENVLPAIVPFLAPSLQPASPISWNYTTVPQANLNNRVLAYSRGKILGGSSSINFMTYTRGSDDDYDRWAALTSDSRWAWRNLNPYYLKNSHLVPSADGHNTKGQLDPAVHGNGPIEVSITGFRTELDGRVINTTKELKEFPFNLDVQSGNTIGMSNVQSTIGNSRRSSSATAYLDPALSRPNLHVLINAQVTKLFQSGTTARGPSFKTVQFAQSAQALRFNLTAKNEVILAAGSIGTAQILLLSGIGNKTTLAAKGIKPLVDLPDVGQHLNDHPLLPNYFLVNSNNTFDNVLRSPTLAASGIQEWNTTGQGLFCNALANTFGFLRLNSSFFSPAFPDPSPGPKSSHYEMLFIDGYAATEHPTPATGNYITIFTAVMNPVSRGSITLASTDPFTFPNIDPGFYSNELDVKIMVEAVKASRRFLSSSQWKGFVLQRFGDLAEAETDSEIAAATRNIVETIWHPTSTARMSPVGASFGVTDPDLSVKKVSGLRIVDASIFPVVPAAHTVAPVYIVAERGADFIKDTWCKNDSGHH